jgi:hypothetical protein
MTQATLRIGDPTVRGRGDPLAGYDLQLVTASDAGSARAVADSSGAWSAVLMSAAAAPVPVTAYARLRIRDPGGREILIDVPDLRLSIEKEASAITGHAPPDTALDVVLTGQGRPSESLRAFADAQGRWRITAAELAAAGWSTGTVDQALARVVVGGGHLIEALAFRDAPTSTPPPTPMTPSSTPATPASSTPTATATGASASPTSTPPVTAQRTATATPTSTSTLTPTVATTPQRIVLPIAWRGRR